MAQYRIDPEKEAALETITDGLNSVRILNRLILSETLCVSNNDTKRGRKKKDSENSIVIDLAQMDRVLSVLTVQRARIIREITALAKKHDIELDEDEKAVISAEAISKSARQAEEQTKQANIPA